MKVKLYLCGGEKPISQYPLGLGYLKSNCESDKVSIEIVSNPEYLYDADLIGLSTNAWGVKEAVQILQQAKHPVVVGGQGCLWDGIRKYGFKHIVLGEGEYAFRGILSGEITDTVVSLPINDDIDGLKFPERGSYCDMRVR